MKWNKELAKPSEQDVNYAKWGNSPNSKDQASIPPRSQKGAVSQSEQSSTHKWGELARQILTLKGTSSAKQAGARPTFGLRHLLGELVLDNRQSGLLLASPAQRDGKGGTNGTSQLLYSVDEGRVEVDLQLRYSLESRTVTLIGQLVGSEGQDRDVELVPIKGNFLVVDSALQVTADDTFSFHYPNLSKGNYALNIYSGLEAIHIIPLQL